MTLHWTGRSDWLRDPAWRQQDRDEHPDDSDNEPCPNDYMVLTSERREHTGEHRGWVWVLWPCFIDSNGTKFRNSVPEPEEQIISLRLYRTQGYANYAGERMRRKLLGFPDPNKGALRPRKSIEDRFWPKVSKTPTCWEWIGARNSRGYGQINEGGDRGKMLYAHRVSYEMRHGPIPDGHVLDHICRNRGCVNPDHLEAVTQFENCQRGDGRRKTHCQRGHAMTAENTYTRSNGHRWCRQCARDRDRARRARAFTCAICGGGNWSDADGSCLTCGWSPIPDDVLATRGWAFDD